MKNSKPDYDKQIIVVKRYPTLFAKDFLLLLFNLVDSRITSCHDNLSIAQVAWALKTQKPHLVLFHRADIVMKQSKAE